MDSAEQKQSIKKRSGKNLTLEFVQPGFFRLWYHEKKPGKRLSIISHVIEDRMLHEQVKKLAGSAEVKQTRILVTKEL